MAALEKILPMEKEIHLDDMKALKWRALFRYSAERNVGKNISDKTKKDEAKKEFDKTAAWLWIYGGKLRIAIWDVIYNNR